MPSTGQTPSAGHTSTSSANILSILEQTFIEGMTKWRSHAIDSSANLAAYCNLGAFSQSIRMGLTHATFQYQSILCRLNAWLTMLFPLGTWSSICISHNEVLKTHRDTSNEPGTLNYTVTLGDFQGGGLLLESPTGAKALYVDALQKQLLFSVVNTKESPLAFDGNLWHGTESFTGNRWVIRAYTCKHLATFKQEDISALLNWGFPLPGADAASATRSRPTPPIPSPPLPSKFCLVICSSRASEIQAGFSTFGVPHVCVECLENDTIRRQVFRGAAEGIFPRYSLYILQTGRWYIQVGCSSSAKWHFLLVLRYILIFRIGLHVGPISFFCTVWLQA